MACDSLERAVANSTWRAFLDSIKFHCYFTCVLLNKYKDSGLPAYYYILLYTRNASM